MGKNLFVLTLTISWLCAQNVFCTPTKGELFLTPLIENGELEKARSEAEGSFKLSQSGLVVKSYSGFFTIDKKTNSNIFFWLFPAQQNPENAPVLLWVNEMAGFTSLTNIFLETGPFKIDENNTLVERNTSWTKSHSILYIESPVGTGFSFADTEDAYANNANDHARQFYAALQQFLTLFADFQSRDFYLIGQTYAAMAIPHIVKHIEHGNAKSSLKINLKGVIIGCPFFDIQQDKDRGLTLYNFGLIDKEQKKLFDDMMSVAINLIKEGNTEEGSKLGWATIMGPNSLLEQTTGVTDYRSILREDPILEEGRFQKIIDSEELRNAIHVGTRKFIGENENVYVRFAGDFATANKEVFEEMLEQGYRVLLFAAQFDIMTGLNSLTNLIDTLSWNGSADFARSKRNIWRVNGKVAGYVKSTDRFTYAMIRNAGNNVISDQPDYVADLVEKFLYNKEF